MTSMRLLIGGLARGQLGRLSQHSAADSPLEPEARADLAITRTAMQLVEDRSRWADLIRFDPTSRYRTRVDVDGDYEAWLLTWLPGQHSGWHDHGGSAGAVVVLQGILTEQRGIDHRDGPPRIADFSCQYADVSVRSFGTRHLHLLGNATPRPAVSLHLYRPAPTEFGVFRVNGAHLERTTPS